MNQVSPNQITLRSQALPNLIKVKYNKNQSQVKDFYPIFPSWISKDQIIQNHQTLLNNIKKSKVKELKKMKK